MSAPRKPNPSNALTYLVVAMFVAAALGFGFLLFGDLFVIGTGVLGMIVVLGLFHYVVWGKSMMDQSKKSISTDSDKTNSQ
jgi:high-affinity Fe2+/Pb2+ permease